MKSYLQGLITGGLFVTIFILLVGATNTSSPFIYSYGKYNISTTSIIDRNGIPRIFETIIHTPTGEIVERIQKTDNFYKQAKN